MDTKLRRAELSVSDADTLKIFDSAEYGFLSLNCADGYPYCVPINFVRRQDVIYAHCALEGKKIDCIKGGSKASFCAVVNARTLPEKLSASFASAMAFGEVSMCSNDGEKISALRLLVKKLAPNHIDKGELAMEKSLHRTGVIKFKILALSGKVKNMPKL